MAIIGHARKLLPSLVLVMALSRLPLPFYITKLALPETKYEVSPFGDCITLHTTVGKLNALFATEFYNYKIDGLKNTVVRTEQYSLPSSLEEYVKYALETVHLPIPPPLSSRQSRKPVDDFSANVIGGSGSEEEMILPGYTSPALIKELYNVTTTAEQVQASIGTQAPAGEMGGSWGEKYQAVFATWGQVFQQSDIDAFNKRFDLEAFNLSKVHLPANVSRNCEVDPAHAWMGCKTADLTVEYLSAIGEAIPTAFVYAPWNNSAEGESGYIDPFTQMITFFLTKILPLFPLLGKMTGMFLAAKAERTH